MKGVDSNVDNSNYWIQQRLGLKLPPCYMLIPTDSKELWETHVKEGNLLFIRCKPDDDSLTFENHIFRILCVSTEEPKLVVCIAKEHEETLANCLNNPEKLSDQFYHEAHQYIWLPWFAELKEWALEIHRLMPIGVEQRGVLVR